MYSNLKDRLTGCFYTIFTPFLENEDIDYENLEKYLTILYKQGARKFYAMAYNSRYSQLNDKEIYQLNDLAIDGFWPEKVILLDIDPKISLSRQKIADRIGSGEVDFFQKVRSGYLKLADEFESQFLVLNATKSIDENVNSICNWLEIDNT